MATVSKAFFRGAATTTTSTTLYTVPSNTTSVVTSIVISNTASSSGTYKISLADVVLADDIFIAAKDSTVIDIKQPITAAQTIKGGASATSINFHIAGVEIS
jgi:hypothetical protein